MGDLIKDIDLGNFENPTLQCKLICTRLYVGTLQGLVPDFGRVERVIVLTYLQHCPMSIIIFIAANHVIVVLAVVNYISVRTSLYFM